MHTNAVYGRQKNNAMWIILGNKNVEFYNFFVFASAF